MNIGDIRRVKALCWELRSLAHAMEHEERPPTGALHADNFCFIGPLRAQAALRRRSLDLTRALAEMRRTR